MLVIFCRVCGGKRGRHGGFIEIACENLFSWRMGVPQTIPILSIQFPLELFTVLSNFLYKIFKSITIGISNTGP